VKLERETVLHIAKLARIELSEEDVAAYVGQLSDILGHFDVLNAVNTEGVEPTAHAFPVQNVMSDDVSRPSLPQADVLAMAPATDDGFLRVRAVLEQ
jgi:aspartyl-tRNA(Asn)/glutamyl-tRNA(Gln) amidotransferase subunit C